MKIRDDSKINKLLQQNDEAKNELFFDENGNPKRYTVQDISKTLELNKISRDMYAQQSKQNEMQRVASIPTSVVIQWLDEGINVMNPTSEDIKKIHKKLNSPEYKYLRTGGGRL
ncbi:MAG: hypothetical protein Unbinned4512contig1001_25 [Prokaryotic dsDNA virus sp.]|nr:MAG: hypothetical protein Unbinned4512contig1001_25 [Prokaryotic dsDNA virus sp.]|tara:strand:- start:3778 stop:4119 length:342 start_codon:yes stop_codon:yes gene_type:complete